MNEDATWHEFKLGLGPGHIVLDGDPAPSQKGHCPNFRPMSIVAKRSPISATAEHLLVLTCALIVALFLQSSIISAN